MLVKPISEILDNPAQMKALDPGDMLGLTVDFPNQCRRGAELGRQFERDIRPQTSIQNIVVTGMGGSAIGGDILRCLIEEAGVVPLSVNRGYDLPGYVGSHTLVIAASYSGNTEETLASYRAAHSRRAQVAVITSGGALAELARKDKVPLCIIPGGQPPRASTGYLFFPALIYLISRGGVNRDLSGDIDESLQLMAKMRTELGPEAPTVNNEAKTIAEQLYRRLPIIYGSQDYGAVAALRWRTQINENSKCLAFPYAFPEMNHNEILGWTLAHKLQSRNFATVILQDPSELEKTLPGSDPRRRIGRRIEVTKDLIHRATRLINVVARGESLLSRMLSLIYLGDFTSVYLAYLNQIDPTNIDNINILKAKMAKLRS